MAAAWCVPGASAEVWGYVDASGQPHFASQPLDERYQLFFKGDGPLPVTAPTDGQPLPPGQGASSSPPSPAAPIAPAPAPSFVNEAAWRRYAPLIEQHADAHDVDPALVKAIVAVESGFEAKAVSPKGARGLMQVMPGTAARYGVSSDRRRTAEEKLLDPATNLQVGTRYLRDLLARFADNLTLALAAYNAGENAVEKYRNRVPPYRETMEYVKRVQQVYATLRLPVVEPEVPAPRPPVLLARKRISGTFLARPSEPPDSEKPVL